MPMLADTCTRWAPKVNGCCRATAIRSASGAVPEGVVDLLEAVEVQEHDGHSAPGLALTCEGVLEPIPEQRPVGQPGERVVERLVHQLGLKRGPVRHVAAVQHQPAHVRVVEQVGDRQLDVAGASVGVPPGGAHAVHAKRFRRNVRQGLEEVRSPCRGHQVAQRRTFDLARLEAEQSFRRSALVLDAGVGVHNCDHVRAVLHQGGEALPARGELTGAFTDALLEVLGQIAVLPEGEDLARDEEHHDQAAHPGHERVALTGAEDFHRGRQQGEQDGRRREEGAEGTCGQARGLVAPGGVEL
jgi:hypothetical protein